MQTIIELNSSLDSISKVEKFIDEISANVNISSEIYGKILIATIEAVNNAIVHGNKLNSNKIVRVKIESEGNRLKVIVEDEGPGFDFYNLPDPTTPQNIENISGRGVFLMRKLSDEINFFNNGSLVELIFYL
ncbi:MAG TPA: ATP-binding protein [Tenuifilaceae bacterium]|jgi:serine/threonine-protein kinase RsbW|nr:ATP-binding protein [Bacteroidales bacterium]HOA08715.1 ATP-binding protein [Tenuifilaceae bacterium]HOC35449.1 ATP-binding protein [Tenuifilaceae bacterium]HOG71218.1 ATP-binding protein [Tenuifilaceae bacterium]HOW19959.1 ATP-binding protein [Tenuifilaceae bacterium]